MNLFNLASRKIKALFRPAMYHGWGRSRKYFEGWYYKMVSADKQNAIAIIPGIAMDNIGNKQSFIQILDGRKLTSDYIRLSESAFSAHSSKFNIQIANNHFSHNEVQLNLKSYSGTLLFKNQVEWPSSWYSPGIMGPFSFVPFMECYHGVLSMDHDLVGGLYIHGEYVDFDGGKGYMEKDWGHSFPSGYVWMQSNHFSQPGISVKASVAKIPWLRSSFVGFIAGIWLKDTLIQFTTYNFTTLKRSFVDKEKVELIMENRIHRLVIQAKREDATQLASPILGFMDGRIEESMNAELKVNLIHKKSGEILLNDTGFSAGLEVAGNLDDILVL